MARERLLKLAVTGLAAGAFSALFGVGGGSVMVPLLIFWVALGERRATATSLAAIVVIAAVAAAAHGGYGNVDVAKGLFIGVPGVAGVLAGTALQQRVPERTGSLLFSLLLFAVAAELIL